MSQLGIRMARGTQVDARSSTHSFLPHCVSAVLPPLAKQGKLPSHVGDSLTAGPWAQGVQRHFQMLFVVLWDSSFVPWYEYTVFGDQDL